MSSEPSAAVQPLGIPAERPQISEDVMKTTSRRSAAVTLIALTFAVTAFAGDPPAWLRQAASVKNPTYDKEVRGVVLKNEQEVTVSESGKLVTIDRFAVRILIREGRGLAIARAFYLASASKVKNIEGWLINSNGAVKEFGKKEVLDIIADPDDVYNEGRLKIIDGSDSADTGSVFGYTVETESPMLFYQDIWQFQNKLPTLSSRYILNLPAGWSATSIVFNHSDVKPAMTGNTYVWEMGGLGPIKDEPLSPSVINLAPFMAVNFGPAEGARDRTFDSWRDVSLWASGLYDPQAVVDDSVALKARELTAGAKTELEKIRAIGTYVQNLQYISIDIGVAYGNGYRPRPANLVLARGYGDCKDKATLMRAMLKALKIEAYPIAIFVGDRTFVKKEWVSPRQFNHCIIAVVVSPETEAPTVIETEKLGRLLIFDATDELTPVGDLPESLQGSYGVIIAGADGDLFEMPSTSPEDNAMERSLEVKLDSSGSIAGTIREYSKGQSSREERLRYRKLSKSDYRKMIEGWLAGGASAAKLIDMSPEDNHAEASFDLSVEFQAPGYGQLMQNRLLIFKPAIVSRLRGIYLTDKERVHPVELDAGSFSETSVIDLPAGFEVDEMPDPLSLKTSFGSYTSTYEIKDGKLIFTRRMLTRRSMVPVEEYNELLDFYKKIIDAEQSPVVLMRN